MHEQDAGVRRQDDRDALIARLRARHRELDQQVERLAARPYLTPAEAHEQRRLKKLKLLTKDRLHALTRQA